MQFTARLVIPLALLLTACPTTPANEAPAFIITAPGEGSLITAGHGVELIGVVDDADDVPETLRVTWSVDGQPLCVDRSPHPDGRSECTWVAVLGGGAIEAVVTDPEGLTGSATVSVQVQALNIDPTCSFDAPAAGSNFGVTDTLTLQGTVADADDDVLTVAFTSSLDKDLGVADPDGSGVVTLEVGPLSVGEHLLTMTTSDPHGASCVADVEIEVSLEDTAPPPDTDVPDPDTDVPDPDTATPDPS